MRLEQRYGVQDFWGRMGWCLAPALHFYAAKKSLRRAAFLYAAGPPRVVHLDLRSFRPKYSIANNAAMVEATIAARTRISRREIPRSSCRIRGGALTWLRIPSQSGKL